MDSDESLLEDSVFSGGESSEYEAPKKTKPAPKKTMAPKPKKPAATKAKSTASKKRPKPDSDIENSDADNDSFHDASLLSNTPPNKKKKAAPVKKSSGKPLTEIANESFDMRDDEAVALGVGPEDASKKYQKLTHLQHILVRPDTYIGSVVPQEQEMWVYNSKTDAIEFREIRFVPGLYKIFDEILVNAADNKQNDKSMSEIKVVVDRENGEISVQNDGKGIPIEMHKEHGMYIPEMIFGHLLTSSNYDDNQAKITGGRNGYGAKLCNVFSTQFSLETVDSKQKKKYKQTWTENMTKKGKPSITTNAGKDYTKVTFRPDWSKFNMEGMDDDFEALVKRRIYDMAGTCHGVKVSLNGMRVKVKDFKSYMGMYTKALQADQPEGAEQKKDVILVDTPNARWEVGFAVSDGSFKQVSFVNSIATTLGGTHVKYVADQIIQKLMDHVKKGNKKMIALKPAQIQNHIFLFVNCSIVNASFSSQTKEQLTTKPSQFGSKYQASESFLKNICKTEVITNILDFAQKKADQLMAKSDGSKRARMNNSKLTDANKAGTKDGWRCTLILTEGDSASGLALAGRAVLDPDHIGVFPLRGKMLNVRDASVKQITENQEIQNIKKFMGLQHKKEYTDTRGLRYGHLMIMTDQDHDGSHIKGLLINFLETQFPSLLRLPNFLKVFITPIVKCWKGDIKNPTKSKVFYTMPEYEEWRLQPGNATWEHKYFKGLGTSSNEDAEGYFRDLDRHLKEFEEMKPDEPELLDLAFSKKKADARKNWLREFVPGTFLDMSARTISYNNFINKELILFSMADNQRSIPSVIDGLKPSQRKVMYTCFRINLKKDRKVVELAGTVSGLTAYPYGESSLQQTIVGLAHNFVGSNNMNLLEPSGNFGSRRLGGQDAASARYIYTRLSPFARRVYNQLDEPLLEYNLDDGKQIEPTQYVPVVPVLLMNGADGIGTGWSTSIPNYNPEDIVDNLRRRMKGDSKEDMIPMQPWYRGFKGAVRAVDDTKWAFSGIANQTGDNEVEITELPVRYWTQDFKDKLEDIIKAEKTPSIVKDYAEYNTPTTVHFVIKMEDKHIKNAIEKGLDETFKLTKTMATSNLVAFDAQGRIHKYETVMDIMEEFYIFRLKYYEKRRAHMLEVLENELRKLSNQSRFVKMIIDGELVVSKKKKLVLVDELRRLGFQPFPKVKDAKAAGEKEEVVADADEDSEEDGGSASDFDYLLGMAIWSLTEERVAKLKKQIGDKEVEIDDLIKLTPKDLWNKDLDEFIEEWRFQLEDEKVRAKKARSAGRRVSNKLGLAPAKGGKRKRKGGSDDESDGDFAVGAKKKKPAAKSVMDRIKTKQPSALLSYFSKSAQDHKEAKEAKDAKTKVEQSDDDFMDIDEFVADSKAGADRPSVVVVKKPAQTTDAQKKITVAKASAPALAPPRKELEDIDDVFAAVAEQVSKKPSEEPRQRRAAAKKKTYVLDDSDSEASVANDQLGDVSMMVKGIGTGDGSDSNSASRPLFSNTAARPSSSHGRLPVTKPKMTDLDESDGIDETDYKGLIPVGSPVRPAARRAGEVIPVEDESMDDSLDMPPPQPKPKVVAKKTATKPASKAAVKKADPPPSAADAAKKAIPLSPAAKAYAAKQAKAASAGASKSSDVKAAIKPAAKAAAKPSAKAAAKPAAKSAAKVTKAAPKKKKVESDDEDDLANDILDDDSEVVIAPKRGARPGRAAAAKKAPVYYDEESEDEEEEDYDEGSFMVEDSD